MENQKKKQSYRKYDTDFKSEALKLVRSGRSVPDVARSLGIGDNLLYKWRSEDTAHQPKVVQEGFAELAFLRKQVRQLEQERDILKKALVIFSQKT
jgi:transposase